MGISVSTRKAIAFTFLFFIFYSNSWADIRKRIVILETMKAPIVQQFTSAFLKQVETLGYLDGKNAEFVKLNAQGSPEKAKALLMDALRKEQADVIVSVATLASKTAKSIVINQNIPLVFMCVTDPVGANLIDHVGQPTGTNITGKIHYVSATAKIQLVSRIIKTKFPQKTVRFGYIYTDYPADMSDYQRMLAAAKKQTDITFIPYKIRYKPLTEHKKKMLKELEKAAKELDKQVDFFWAPRGVLAVLPEHDQILINNASKPLLVGVTEESVQQGALLHITGDPESQGEDTAIIVDQILKGKAPGEIAPSLPRKIQFSLNLKTAVDLNLFIPSDILELAKGRTYY